MTDNNHPITPPPELVERLRAEALNSFPDDENPCPCDIDDARDEYIATQSARWGADQELEACCEWMRQSYQDGFTADLLRSARRPKPPSLKERGREALQNIHAAVVMETGGRELDVLKEIVESLPD